MAEETPQEVQTSLIEDTPPLPEAPAEVPQSNPTPISPDQPLTVEAVTAAVEGYTLSKWNGIDNYSCTSCPFETLDLDAMLLHIIQMHVHQGVTEGRLLSVPIYDRYGNLVTRGT